MSVEGNRIINRMPSNFYLAPELVNLRSVDNNVRERIEKFYPTTDQFLQLMLSLIEDNNCRITPVILTHPHLEHGRKKHKIASDFIRLSIPTSKYGIEIYGDNKGHFSFSVFDNLSQPNKSRSRKQKIPSTQKKFSDAIITKQTLAKILREINCRNVSIDGPTDIEPFVVMTRLRSPSIAKSAKGDILGLVFKQAVDLKNQIVRGNIQFLVRERVK